jgi:DNA-binding MarR family transcriptional regulator
MCHAEVQAELDAAFQSAGHPRVQGAATQPLVDAPDGLRLTELAQIAGVSKQAMAEAVNAMIDAGYIERVPDPTDGRARRLRLTAYGREVGQFARRVVRGVETRWEARVGPRRAPALRETLRSIAESRAIVDVEKVLARAPAEPKSRRRG